MPRFLRGRRTRTSSLQVHHAELGVQTLENLYGAALEEIKTKVVTPSRTRHAVDDFYPRSMCCTRHDTRTSVAQDTELTEARRRNSLLEQQLAEMQTKLVILAACVRTPMHLMLLRKRRLQQRSKGGGTVLLCAFENESIAHVYSTRAY